MEALECLLEDEGFQLPTKLAISALRTARDLHGWASTGENDELRAFATKLVATLLRCTDSSPGKACQQA